MSLIGLSKGQFVSFNTIKALVFDTFGTVVDWRTSIIRQLSELGARKHLEVDWEASPMRGARAIIRQWTEFGAVNSRL